MLAEKAALVIPKNRKRIIRLLAERFNDESPVVRSLSIKALGNIGAKDPDLISNYIDEIISMAVDETPSVRASVAETLGMIGMERPSLISNKIDVLVDLLADPDETVRYSAAKALEKIRNALNMPHWDAA